MCHWTPLHVFSQIKMKKPKFKVLKNQIFSFSFYYYFSVELDAKKGGVVAFRSATKMKHTSKLNKIVRLILNRFHAEA